jgi:hypothetical protein
MKDCLELHVVATQVQGWPELDLLLVGEKFHPHKWLRRFPPAYARIPKVGGDYVQFRGGPYRTPEEYGPIVAELGSVILASPLRLLIIEQDRLKPTIMSEFNEKPFQTFGPRLVENIANAIGEATDRSVSIGGDPHTFEVIDFNSSVADDQPLTIPDELRDHPFFNP